MGPWSTLTRVLHAISIRDGSASIFLLPPLLSWSPLSISGGDVGLVFVYEGALDDCMDLRVKQCVGRFRG